MNLQETKELHMGTVPRKLVKTLALLIPVAIVILGIIAPPAAVLDKAHLIGYGICHQIPERTFFFNDRPLPLCARCSGTYLGTVLGFAGLVVMGRRRVGELPPKHVILVLFGFIVLMGLDGLNSYMTFFPNTPHLYEPHNLLRLTTGLLNGLALILIVYPVFNYTLWQNVDNRRSITALWELLFFLPGIGLIAWIMESGSGFWLYPLSIISTFGVLLMLTMVNTMIVLILIRRESAASTWREAVVPLLWGLVFGMAELGVMVAVRTFLTHTIGLPI